MCDENRPHGVGSNEALQQREGDKVENSIPTAQNLFYNDLNNDDIQVNGILTWDGAIDEAEVKEYHVYFVSQSNVRTLMKSIPKGSTYEYTFNELVVPKHSEKLAVYAVDNSDAEYPAHAWVYYFNLTL